MKEFIVQAKRSDVQRDNKDSHKDYSLTPKIYVYVFVFEEKEGDED